MFEISHRRILLIARAIKNGEEMKEKRGGDRWKNKLSDKKQAVIDFIGKFKACESHYGRAKSQRLYLPSELNISKMWKMYNKATEERLQVNYIYFNRIFCNNFNIGFGSPAVDVCSYCERTKHLIKTQIGDTPKRAELTRELQVHKLRSKQFHLLMKTHDEGTVNFCFDLQQVHNLPAVPIQETYYSLQIAFYAFCVVNIESTDPHFYTWTEDLSGRGSNEIGSALLHFLRNQNFENITKIKLFADGCAGQNKNSHVMHLLMYWLYKEAPPHVTEIIITFPVRGHSYLPADRVFGRVQKEIKRHSRIILPKDYQNLYEKFGNVYVMGTDWFVYDLKALSNTFKKLDGISEQKRIFLLKEQKAVKIKMEMNFRIEDPSKKPLSLVKRGQKIDNLMLNQKPEKRALSADKGKAVNKLLHEAFGKEWYRETQYQWYFDLLRDFIVETVPNKEDEGQEHCTCLDVEKELKL